VARPLGCGVEIRLDISAGYARATLPPPAEPGLATLMSRNPLCLAIRPARAPVLLYNQVSTALESGKWQGRPSPLTRSQTSSAKVAGVSSTAPSAAHAANSASF